MQGFARVLDDWLRAEAYDWRYRLLKDDYSNVTDGGSTLEKEHLSETGEWILGSGSVMTYDGPDLTYGPASEDWQVAYVRVMTKRSASGSWEVFGDLELNDGNAVSVGVNEELEIDSSTMTLDLDASSSSSNTNLAGIVFAMQQATLDSRARDYWWKFHWHDSNDPASLTSGNQTYGPTKSGDGEVEWRENGSGQLQFQTGGSVSEIKFDPWGGSDTTVRSVSVSVATDSSTGTYHPFALIDVGDESVRTNDQIFFQSGDLVIDI